MPYTGYKIYGPYLRKDGRKHIIAISKNGHRMTISYPKYLMELHLKRLMHSSETIDHIDRDYTNNELSNLRVVSQSKNSAEDAMLRQPENFVCQVCKKQFTLSGAKLSRADRSRNKCGPFCSRSCAGKATNMVGLVSLYVPHKYKMFDKQV